MKINVNKTDKIEIVIRKTEEGCRARLFPISEIPDMIIRAEQKLATLGLPKKVWNGCIIKYSPEKVANSYRGKAEGTAIEIMRHPSGWFLTYCDRIQVGQCSYGSGGRSTLQLGNAAMEALPRNYIL